MPPLQPQRGKLLFDVGALLQLGHKVHFFNDLPGGNVCFAHALFANARHKANYYLILEVDSGATARGLNATIQMNGCYLI